MPPPLPPGFVLQQPSAPPPQAAPAPPDGYVIAPARPVVAIGRPPREPPPQTPPQALHDEHTARTAGLPTGFEWDADGRGAHPIHGTPQDPTYGQNALDPASVTEAERRIAQAMITGHVPPPSGRTLASPQTQRLLAVASQIDPEFDLTTWARRNAANRAFTSGIQGQNITAFNTAIHHLDTLAQASDSLNNWGSESTPAALSHVSNIVRNAMANGDLAGRLTTFDTAATGVANELTRAFRGTGGAEADVQAWRANLRPNMTPQELHAAVQTAIALLRGRIEAMNSSYRQAMGPNATVEDLIDPHSREILHRLESGDLASPPAPPGAPNSRPPPGGPGGPTNGGNPPPQDGYRLGQQLQAAPSGSEDRFRLLEAYHNAEDGHLSRVWVGGFGGDRTSQAPENGWGVTRDQDQAFEREYQTALRARAAVAQQRGGSPEATGRAYLENAVNSGVPLVGSLVQADQALRGPEAGNALLHGGQDWALLGGRDELSAGLRSLFGGDSYDQNIATERGVDAYDNENHFGDRLAGQIMTGLPEASLPGGMGTQMARGGAQGAAYGFGSGEGGFNERAPSALVGGTIGALAPPVFSVAGRAARPVANFLSRPFRSGIEVTPAGQEIAQAGEAEGVPLSRPVVDPTARNRMMALESQVGGHGPVRDSLNATATGIENAVGANVAGQGAADERGAMGARVQQAVQNFVAQSGRKIGAMYTRAANMARGVSVRPETAVQRIDQHLADLQENPGQNADVINFLRTVRGDLVDENGALRPKTVAAIRDMRTNLRGNIDHADLTHTNAERIMSDVLDGAGQDVNRDLGAANPAANRLFQQADQQWAARHNEITQVVDKLVGRGNNPIGGGEVMNRVSGFMTGDVPRLQRVMAMLSPAERADLRATVAARAGYKSPDEPFSVPQFLAWQRSIPESARQVVFGADGAKSIQNLTILSRALQNTRNALNNSRSGAARNIAAFWQSALGGLVPSVTASVASGGSVSGTAIGATALSGTIAAAMAGIRRLSARALMNPDMSRWLALAPRQTTPGALRTHIGVLGGIAARNPAIAQEALGLQRTLLRAANDNASAITSSAASGGRSDADSNQQ